LTAGTITRGLPLLALVFNAFTWGVSWWPFRQFEQRGLHPLWLTALTFTVAVVGLVIARPRALPEVLRTPTLWVLVLAAGTTNACFNWSVTIGDVVRVVLLFYLMPIWAVLLARVLLRERLTSLAALRVALALSGAMVVLWPADGRLALALSGPDLLAILGGFTFALNNVMLRREAQRSEAARALAMFGGGALVSLVLAFLLTATGQVTPLPAPSWAWLVGLTLMTVWFLGSNLALQYGAARLPALTTAAVMVTEVLFASASAIALGAGTMTWRVALGGLLIVAASLLAAWRRPE
jgi:drug/metabolite transporter (DMT)-like permease